MVHGAVTRRTATRAAWLTLILFAVSSPAAGQASPQPTHEEFVRQGLLIPGFTVAEGVDRRAAGKAGGAARSAAQDRANPRSVDVIGGGPIDRARIRAGHTDADRWVEPDIRMLAQHLRADEYVVGLVEDDGRRGGPARVSGTLVLMRDQRMRQPLPAVTGRSLEDAARAFGEQVIAARAQMTPLRRCENALRDGKPELAVRAAREGVAAYPQAILARTCLIWALRAVNAPATEMLVAGREILAIDSLNAHGLSWTATALDSLGRNRESAPLWLRLSSTNPTDPELTERVLFALSLGGSLEEAEALAVRAEADNPSHRPFTWHKWRTAYDRQSWTHAREAGEVLLASDSVATGDPLFFRRLANVYRALGMPYKAVEIAARGVSRFPNDARIQALYAQYVLAEADTVLARGLAQFPQHGELHALQSQRLRGHGDLAGAAAAMRRAIAADSTIPDAALLLAQAELDLGRPDSALAALRAALVTGGDSARIAQFAVARGNAFYRAAQATRSASDHALSLRFIALADSLRQTPQTRLLLGMAALGAAQAAFTEAASNPDRARSCELAQYGTGMLPIARASLPAGRAASAEAVEQGLDYLRQLEPYSEEIVRGKCPVN